MRKPDHPIPAAALEQHVAILGKTGSGKTSTAKLAVEQVVGDGARVCILDPIKSDWWGITSSASGKSAGLAFDILGGPHGHVSLHASAGKAIAELVATGALPLSILDMADFEPGGQARFFKEFAPALLRRMRGVVYLVIEEAHLFAPKERSGVGDENLSIHWAKMLATAGRSKGIRLILLTQRTQSLHNALLGSCDTMIAHRMTAPADQEPVKKWLKANTDDDTTKRVSGSLSSLKTGHGWICSGEAKIYELVHFPRISTYDNTATPTGRGEEQRVKTAPVDLQKLRTIIGDAVEEAEANDPKKLKAENAALKRQIGEAARLGEKIAAAQPSRAELLEAEKAGYQAGRLDGYAEGATFIRPLVVNLVSAMERLDPAKEAASNIMRAMDNIAATKPREARPRLDDRSKAARSTLDRIATAPMPRPPARPRADGDAKLPDGEQKILVACAQHDRHRGCTREQLSILTGYKRSTRNAYIARLQGRGLVLEDGERIQATADGFDALGSSYEPLPTGERLQEYWDKRLPTGERAIFVNVINAYPSAIDRETLSDRTGFKRSTRNVYIARLAARQLVTTPGNSVKAADFLFEG